MSSWVQSDTSASRPTSNEENGKGRGKGKGPAMHVAKARGMEDLSKEVGRSREGYIKPS
jgi:hypothetical protein